MLYAWHCIGHTPFMEFTVWSRKQTLIEESHTDMCVCNGDEGWGGGYGTLWQHMIRGLLRAEEAEIWRMSSCQLGKEERESFLSRGTACVKAWWWEEGCEFEEQRKYWYVGCYSFHWGLFTKSNGTPLKAFRQQQWWEGCDVCDMTWCTLRKGYSRGGKEIG